LARNPQTRKEYSIQSRDFVRRKFSYDETTGKLNELYTELL